MARMEAVTLKLEVVVAVLEKVEPPKPFLSRLLVLREDIQYTVNLFFNNSMLALMFGLVVYMLVFTLLYMAFKEHFIGITSFKDAVYHSTMMTTTIGNRDVKPNTNTGKVLSMIHIYLVFVSVFNFKLMKNSTMIFGLLNLGVIAAFAAAHVFLEGMSIMDGLYHSTMTHTFTGAMEDRNSTITLVHVLVMFAVLFSIPNTGVLGVISNTLSPFGKKNGGYNGMDPSFYK